MTGKLVAPYKSTEVLKRRVFTIRYEAMVLSLSLSQGLQFFVVVWASWSCSTRVEAPYAAPFIRPLNRCI